MEVATFNHWTFLAGKVMWGMGFQPPANADMVNVGGDVYDNNTNITGVGGNTRIGGAYHAPANNGSQMFITTQENLQKTGASDRLVNTYPYPDQQNATIKTNLGKTAALKVDTTGNNDIIDFNDYTRKTLIPLSDKLAALKNTGTVSYTKAPDVTDYSHRDIGINPYTNYQPDGNGGLNIENEGKIVFTGDGQQNKQVFTVDLTKAESAAASLKTNGSWSLDFENIPDGQPIIINVTGKSDVTWIPGWRIWVNGVNYSTYINDFGQSWSRYRSIASRIMWNYANVSKLMITGASDAGKMDLDTGTKLRGAGSNNGLVQFPGSILIPRGELGTQATTNGRLLIGKDLTLNTLEHHNAPWIGFDEPQCFAVSGRTEATLG
ncbi:choice-of-anchor A family protein [Bifidobacterium sp. SO1]|nr:choice-of-anchor A family protein [Bifidobacterium sp. SO1]